MNLKHQRLICFIISPQLVIFYIYFIYNYCIPDTKSRIPRDSVKQMAFLSKIIHMLNEDIRDRWHDRCGLPPISHGFWRRLRTEGYYSLPGHCLG